MLNILLEKPLYVPAAFAESDLHTLFTFMETHSFAILISDASGEPVASHLPLLLDRTVGARGTLLGHMALANPQWRHAEGRRVLVIFSGPHAYISPTWYEANGTVPTWNYVTVHAYGTFRQVDNLDQTLSTIARTVERYESSMPTPWRFDSAAETSHQLAKGVVAFQIEIDRLEGKWKLNQNHPPERREKVIRALESSSDADSRAIASLVRDALHPRPPIH